MIPKLLSKTALAAALAAPLALAGMPATADTYPSERLNWTIAFGPGGGNDVMSRTLIEIIDKYDLYPDNIVAENRAGGSGAVGWGFVHSNAGNPYHVSTTSGSFITTPLQADTPWGPDTFTHVALLASDDLVLVVNKDSPIQTFEEFVERAKESAPTIGGMGSVNVDLIVPTVLSEKAGFDFEYVAFQNQGELTTAVLSDALDSMVANPGLVMGLIESGDLRALAHSGVSVPEALGDLNTFGDYGYEVGISMPRGLVLPPDVPEEAREWWIATIKKIVETPEWKDYVQGQFLTENVMYGDEFRDFLMNTQEQFARVLKDIGAIQ